MKQFNYKCVVSKNGTKMYYKRVNKKWKRISNKVGMKAEKGKKKYRQTIKKSDRGQICGEVGNTTFECDYDKNEICQYEDGQKGSCVVNPCTNIQKVTKKTLECKGIEDPVSYDKINEGYCLDTKCFDRSTLSKLNPRQSPINRRDINSELNAVGIQPQPQPQPQHQPHLNLNRTGYDNTGERIRLQRQEQRNRTSQRQQQQMRALMRLSRQRPL